MGVNETHSFRDYTHGTAEGLPVAFGGTPLAKLPPEEFSGTTIRGSCLSCEVPDTPVFPAGTKALTFDSCNLDNVLLPPGSVVLDNCSARRFLVQPDGEDWLVDADNRPLRPLSAPDVEVVITSEDGTVL